MSTSPLERRNARIFIWSNGLQGIGDQIVAAKTVLPWLFQAAGVPGFFTGLLVPIRESGSMLPQAALTPWVTTHASRKRLWLIGSLGQAVCAGLMGVLALVASGAWLGLGIVFLLAGLSLFRALCSLAGKDVQGRTITKGTRGEVTGKATQLGGAVTLLVGIVLAVLGDLPQWALALLIGLGAATWAGAAAVFSRIEEPVPQEQPQGMQTGWMADTWALFTDDSRFRNFVIVRSLLLVSALSTSFIVVLAAEAGTSALAGLGSFVLASGLASLVGGRVSGVFSDKSSRNVMAVGAGAASLILVTLVASAALLPAAVNAWVMPLGFFGVNLAHTAIRVARKTYVVDMAEGDQRTRYVGAANTLMGIFLLVVGAMSAAMAAVGTSAALLFLAVMGVVGVIRARTLVDVSAPNAPSEP